MIRFKAGLPLIAAIIALGTAGLAFAHEHGGASSQEAAAALAAKTTLTQAITAAEQQTGGRALRIKFEDHHGNPKYAVKVITKDDKLSEVSLDPASGKVLRTETEGMISRVFDRDDRADAAKLKKAPTTLAGAVAAAEQQVGGKAFEAGYENENGRMQFRVAVAKGQAVSDVKVDGATGKVVKVETAGDREQHEGEQHED